MIVVVLALVAAQPEECANEPKPFVCSRAEPDAGPSLNWPKKRATFRVNGNSVPAHLSARTVVGVVRASFAAWSAVEGAAFELTYGGLTTQTKVGFDFKHIDTNENIVIFQDEWRHDEGIIGLTTATFNAQSGEIFDADIELNASPDAGYYFTTNDVDIRTDVQNTVTHEVGHFLGFDHTDKEGSTVDPACASTATMARRAQEGDINKRTIWYTDAVGMRTVYPADKMTAQFCSKEETPKPDPATPPTIEQVSFSLGGCNAAGLPWLIGLLLTLLGRLAFGQSQPATCVNLTDPKPFICSHTGDDTSASLHWKTGAATYRINTASIPPGLDDEAVIAAIRTSFDQWANLDGVDLTLTYSGSSTSTAIGTNYINIGSNENLVIFQADWPHEDKPAERLIIALTTATFNASNGELYDADIELNAEYFHFTISDMQVRSDVRNTVTHEVGHFIGFDHPNKMGSRIPSECARTAAMAASATEGETFKRTLAPTDVLGARTVYPAGKPPQYCSEEESAELPTFSPPNITQTSSSLSGGCSSGSPAWMLVAVALLLRRKSR